MGISRKENGSLVKKAGKTLVDLALSLTSHNAIANSAVTQEVNQINTSKANSSDVTFGNQITANISVSTGAEVGKYIREHIPLSKLQKGYVFNLIPTQSPQWFSGILYCDASTWATGTTCWGFYMNRDNNILYKYNCVYGGTEAVTKLGGNMRPNFSNLLKNFAVGTTVTIDTDSFLVGTVGNYANVTINGNQIVRTRDETVSLCLPVKANDKILVSNWAAEDTDIALHVFGVLY